MGRFQRVAQAVAAVALVAVFAVLMQVRSDVNTASSADVARAEEVSTQNQAILRQIGEEQQVLEDGVAAIERGYACLVALLFVVPEERAAIDPAAVDAVCGIPPETLGLLVAGLDGSTPR